MWLETSSLVPCSFARGREKKHVVIYYPANDSNLCARAVLVFVPVKTPHLPKTASFPSSSRSCSYKEVEHMLPLPEIGKLNYNMGCLVAVGNEGPSLYLFGGLEPPPNCRYNLVEEFVVKGVQCYNLHKLSAAKENRNFRQCNDMVAGMYHPLLAQVDDNIFVFGYGKTEFEVSFKLSFQKYNIQNDEWTSKMIFDVDKCETPNWWVRANLARLPHVVIGSKLHISFGSSSFTYDTEVDSWYDCMLFETFWSGHHSVIDYYGEEVWMGAAEYAKKRSREPTQVGGPPFGFCGRGILWGDNVLMGVYYGENCHIIAYLLNNGRVVKHQPISFNTILGMAGASKPYGAHFIDVGDDCFGLVHFLSDEDEDDLWERTYRMEFLTFKVKRIEADDDRFLEYELISNEVVIEDLPNDSASKLSCAFCVRSL